MKKNKIKRSCEIFFCDFNAIDNKNILDSHKYLIKVTWSKTMFGLIKKIFIGLLTGLVNGSNHTKFASLSNEKWLIHPTLTNLHSNEYSQELHYYPFAIKLDRCVRTRNTLNDLPNKVCILNKTEDLNLSVFNMVTGINESKTLTKYISCEYKCKWNKVKVKSLVE